MKRVIGFLGTMLIFSSPACLNRFRCAQRSSLGSEKIALGQECGCSVQYFGLWVNGRGVWFDW
jgi:hypothetical protein